MTSKEILKKLMKMNNVSYEEMAERLGYSSKSIIYQTLNNGDGMNMKLKTFLKWLDVLDTEIVIQPFSSDDEYILDGISEED